MRNRSIIYIMVISILQLFAAACNQSNSDKISPSSDESDMASTEIFTEPPVKENPPIAGIDQEVAFIDNSDIYRPEETEIKNVLPPFHDPGVPAVGATTPSIPPHGGPSLPLSFDDPYLGLQSPVEASGPGPGFEPPPPPPSPGLVHPPGFLPGSDFFPLGACGNGIRNFDEQCDDGNKDNFDGCNNVCERPFCGNGVLELDEECDDGNNNDADGCSKRCLYERCGNWRIDTITVLNNAGEVLMSNKEECDDGNLKAGDGCSPCCMIERCGNRVLDPGEQCDEGANNNVAGPCTPWCRWEPPCPTSTEE